MKTNMTDGQKKFYMDQAMATYAREIENTSGRVDGLKIVAKEAYENGDLELFYGTKKKIALLVDEARTMYEELERIRSEYMRLEGVAF